MNACLTSTYLMANTRMDLSFTVKLLMTRQTCHGGFLSMWQILSEDFWRRSQVYG
jgi:hypothetical protein